MRKTLILIVLVALAGCVTKSPNVSQLAAPEVPKYAGLVQPVEASVDLMMRPLVKRAALSAQSNTSAIIGGKRSGEHYQIAGYVESNLIGNRTQITYAIDRLDSGAGWQNIPTLLLQASYSAAGELKKMEIGGPLVAQAKPEERQAVAELTAGLERAVGKFSVAGMFGRSISQGDVTQAFRMDDFFRDSGMANPFKNAVSGGPGFSYRLIGRTVLNGRQSYVLHIDGNERLTGPDIDVLCVMGGYVVVDAATGLLSEMQSVAVLAGRSFNEDVRVQVFGKNAIEY